MQEIPNKLAIRAKAVNRKKDDDVKQFWKDFRDSTAIGMGIGISLFGLVVGIFIVLCAALLVLKALGYPV